MHKALYYLAACSALLLSACGSSADNQISQAYTAAAETKVIQGTSTPLPETQTPTNTPLPPPTATPAWVTTAFISGGPLNLRQGPGTFFDSFGSLPNGAKLYVLASIPGGEWFEVLAPRPEGEGQIVGWMNTRYLELSSFYGTIPIVDWPEEQSLYGTVTDENGTPINGVRVAAVFQTEAGEVRADTPTNDQGEFAIYLPPQISGPFDLQITAVNCNSWISVWLDDGTCEVQDYFSVEWRATEFLPLMLPIHFSYEKAVTHLQGKISFADGWGYPGVLVKATRVEDGSESERVSPNDGRFSIPLGYGTWEVVAITFDWYGVPTFSDRVTYIVSEQDQSLEEFNVIIDDIDNPE